MICNYYDSEIAPSIPNTEPSTANIFTIKHNGTKSSVKVGGSEKIFTAQLPEDNQLDIQWSVFDGVNTYTETFGDYTITIDGRTMKLKVAAKYDLVGTVLIIKAQCADGSMGEIQVEVIG